MKPDDAFSGHVGGAAEEHLLHLLVDSVVRGIDEDDIKGILLERWQPCVADDVWAGDRIYVQLHAPSAQPSK